MTDYFQMLYAEEADYEPYGVAYAPPGKPLFLLPPSGTRVESREPITFGLRDGTFADYLANDSGLRLCSKQLKDILELGRSQKDLVQWFEVIVAEPCGEQRNYYALHFPETYPVVNRSASLMHEDIVVKPVLDANAVCDRHLFCLPGGRRTFCSAKIKSAIEAAGLTGMSLSEVKVV